MEHCLSSNIFIIPKKISFCDVIAHIWHHGNKYKSNISTVISKLLMDLGFPSSWESNAHTHSEGTFVCIREAEFILNIILIFLANFNM
jgi:hypothetical protein